MRVSRFLTVYLLLCAVLPIAQCFAESNDVGSMRTFWVSNLRTIPTTFREARAVLVASGDRSQVYVEPGTTLPSSYLKVLSHQLEVASPPGSLFPELSLVQLQEKLFGPLPRTQGGDSRLLVLFTNLGGSNVDALFHPADQWRAADAEKMGDRSNEANIVYINGYQGTFENTTGAVARTLQELLSYRSQAGVPRDLWLSQVIEHATLLASGIYPSSNALRRFSEDTSRFPLVSHSSLQQGPQILFASYLLDQASGRGEALSNLARFTLPGRSAVEALFRSETGSPLTFDLIYNSFLTYIFRMAGSGFVLPVTITTPQGKGLVMPPLEPYLKIKSIPAIADGTVLPYSFAVIELPTELPFSAVVNVETVRDKSLRPDGSMPCSNTGSVLWKPVSPKRIAVYGVGCEHYSDLDVLHFRLSVLDKPFQGAR
jgi:hypothetical protein